MIDLCSAHLEALPSLGLDVGEPAFPALTHRADQSAADANDDNSTDGRERDAATPLDGLRRTIRRVVGTVTAIDVTRRCVR